MNVKKLIEKIEGLNKLYGEKYYVALEDVLDLVKQLDEPQKPVVPQFVADWYENNKDYLEYNFQDWLKHLSEFRLSKNEQFGKWVNEPENNPAETLVKMKLFGYEVKKEKHFRVKVKGICGNHETLNCEKHSNEWLFSSSEENRTYKTKFTRKELEEAGFGWMFDCKGLEVEEVVE